ncbi:hypothetical protein FACS1894216_02350 [Synergistales bacterium]|nr:hypothetical protein FACS1894216_02350 [Synergistales bacterium]
MSENDDISFEFEPRPKSDFWFACVDIEVIRDSALTPTDKAVYAVICSHANIQSRSWVMTVTLIAAEASCSVRTAQKSIQALVTRGVIARVERFKDGKQKACLYQVIGHNAKCYASPQGTPPGGGGEKSDIPRKICTPMGAKSAPRLQESNYENQTYSPTESERSSPENSDPPNSPQAQEAGSWPVNVSEIPAAMRQVAEFLLLKTGRPNISADELIPIRELERIHFPARINQEIDTAIERFRRSGRELSSLTFGYLYESLKHQKSRKYKERAAPRDKAGRRRAAEEREENIRWERERQAEMEKRLEEIYGGEANERDYA